MPFFSPLHFAATDHLNGPRHNVIQGPKSVRIFFFFLQSRFDLTFVFLPDVLCCFSLSVCLRMYNVDQAAHHRFHSFFFFISRNVTTIV